METACKDLDDYSNIITQIADENKFSNTVTINGNTYKLSDYFDSMDDAFEYYHKSDADYHYICKFHEIAGEGIEIAISKSDLTIDVSGVKKKVNVDLVDYQKQIVDDED